MMNQIHKLSLMIRIREKKLEEVMAQAIKLDEELAELRALLKKEEERL